MVWLLPQLYKTHNRHRKTPSFYAYCNDSICRKHPILNNLDSTDPCVSIRTIDFY